MSGYEPLVRALSEALAPLTDAIGDPRAMSLLLSDLGWDEPVDDEVLSAIAALLPFAEALAELPDLIEALDDEDGRTAALASLVEILTDITRGVTALQELEEGVLSALPGRLADPATWRDLGGALLDLLLVRYFENHASVLLLALRLTGLCTDEAVSRGTRPRLHWDRLATVASDPTAAIAETVGWGEDFQGWWVQHEIGRLFARLGLRVRTSARREVVAELLAGGAVDRASGIDTDLILWSGSVAGVQVEFGLILAASSEGEGAIMVGSLASGEWSGSLPLNEDWSVEASGELDGAAAAALVLRPGAAELAGGSAAIEASVELVGSPDDPWVILGNTDGTRMELDGLALGLGITGTVSEPEGRVWIRPTGDGLRIVLDFAAGDGFLKDYLGEGITFEVDFEILWSTLDGLKISGGLGIEISIPVDIKVGPFALYNVHLSLGGSDEGLALEATVDGSFDVGIFVASAMGIGGALQLSASEDGQAGLGAELAFVPPTGLGLAVDLAIASGGGFLYLDHEAGEYAGIVDLKMLGIGVTAIGMLVTKLPDGASGWSLFLSLSATFTGIQLGFGFTLNGLGGLVGINRGVDADALGDGIRRGALDSILFPDDPIAEAARILSDLDAIFPVQVGQHVFGPVARIGWGTPSLIDLDAGVVVELPDPITFTILGSLSTALPTEEVPILILNVDVAGHFDLTAGTIAVDASIRDSSVIGIDLSGDMAMRAAFGDSPTFLLSFGGYHPRFDAPSDFPSLDRLSVSLDTGDNLRITLWGYFALTSNTVQFGSGADLWAKAAGLTVEGGFSFDALIQFNPFWFVVEVGIYVDVRAGKVELFGVYLDLALDGPNPFHFVGTASMKILGIKTTFEIEESIGRKEDEGPRETIDLGQVVVEALEAEGAWRGIDPTSDAEVVLLADDTEGDNRLHPAGSVEIAQRLAPLDTKLEHFGAAKLGSTDRIELSDARIGGGAAGSEAEVVDWFSPASFFELDDEERLSAPSFEELPAGLRIGDDGCEGPESRDFPVGHEVVVQDPDLENEERPDLLHPAPSRGLALGVRRSLLARQRRASGLGVGRTPSSPFGLQAVEFAVTSATTGAIREDLNPGSADSGSTWCAARSALIASGETDLTLRPVHEIEETS